MEPFDRLQEGAFRIYQPQDQFEYQDTEVCIKLEEINDIKCTWSPENGPSVVSRI